MKQTPRSNRRLASRAELLAVRGSASSEAEVVISTVRLVDHPKSRPTSAESPSVRSQLSTRSATAWARVINRHRPEL
jgi:hypothetical protein